MSSTTTAVIDWFNIRPDLAEQIVTEIEAAIDDGNISTTEVSMNIGCEYGPQVHESVDLDEVIEFVANENGLTSNLLCL